MKTKIVINVLFIFILASCAPKNIVVPTNIPLPNEIALPTKIVEPTPTPIPANYPEPLGEQVIFTYYFYWYDSQTGEHLGPHAPARDADSLTDEPISFPAITWRGTEWHRRQIEDMIYAGVDVILPVYWGNRGTEWWSRPGVTNLGQALEEVRLSGKTPPTVAMFYDTNAHLYEPVNLLTDAGKNTVYSDIKFFFTAIPKEYWALTEVNRPMIWFYDSNPLGEIDELFSNYIYTQFENDFGLRPYIVVDSNWVVGNLPVKYDAASVWIAAGSGSTEKITTISPGVDDRWVLEYPSHSYVDRQNGDVYRNAWAKAAICGTPWVAIESWNEYHEATDISETIQYGRFYLDLSHEYSQYFKQGLLTHEKLISKYKVSSEVIAILGENDNFSGLTLNVLDGDGESNVTSKESESARTNVNEAPYLYFEVDDGFYFNTPHEIEITIKFFDEGVGTIYIEYDSAPCASNWFAETMYKQVPVITQSNSKTWRTATITLTDATFTGHQNGFSDFRIAGYETPLIISQIKITKK